MKRSRLKTLCLAGAGLLLAASTAGLAACASDSKTQAQSAPPVIAAAKPATDIVGLRRLTAAQYRRSVADIFGPSIKISGRFEPEVRREGLIAIGSGSASYSASGMEQYYAMAASIAEQALAPANRAKSMSCQPVAADAADDRCASEILSKYGRLLYRRPLTAAELSTRVALANRIAIERKDFHSGLKEALTSLLSSPNFLFRVEQSMPGVGDDGLKELDGYSRASRLSFLFWNTTPDDALLTAAENGDLLTKAGLEREVDRLVASPRSSDGISAFFDDMLQMDLFDYQSKDPQLFPKYNQVMANAAREQTVRTIVNLLVEKKGDYRDIFTTRDTFMTRQLALVYKVPFTGRAEWAPYTFSEESGRAGVLTQISFLSLFSHPARSSPTKRGVALNEIFLCQTTPSPPGDVDFSIVNGEPSPLLKTLRARLEAHVTDESCAGCHTLVDPPGMALERFDSLGQARERDNGELIDVTAEWHGKSFEGAGGLGLLLHDNPGVPACLVNNLYASATGQHVGAAERPLVKDLTAQFIAGGYKAPAFLKTLATSGQLYKVYPQDKPAPATPTKVASAK